MEVHEGAIIHSQQLLDAFEDDVIIFLRCGAGLCITV